MKTKPLAVLFIIISDLSFSFMAVCVKLADDVPLSMKILVRNIVSLSIALIAVKKLKVPAFGKKESQPGLWGRSLVGLASVFFYFYAIDNLNIADAAMLNRIAPFFLMIFASLFLKEKLSKIHIPALIVIFLAAMLIIKPGFNYVLVPAIAGFLSAVTTGGAQTLIRYVSSKEDPITIVFHFSFVSVLILLPVVIFTYQEPTGWQMLALAGTGIFAASGQLALTYGLKLEKATILSVYGYSNVIFNALLGYFFFDELSDAWSLTGAAIIIITSVYIFMYNKNHTDEKS